MRKKGPPNYTPEQLQRLQERSGLTNPAFAAELGVIDRTWEVWKKGSRPIKKINRRAIAHLELELKQREEEAKHGKCKK